MTASKFSKQSVNDFKVGSGILKEDFQA